MHLITRILVFVCIVPTQIFAFDTGCFTDYAELSYTGSSSLFVSTDSRDDLFFTQKNQLIPAHIKPNIKREIAKYVLTSSISTFPINKAGLLIDDLPSTYIEIDPLIGGDGFFITLDFLSIIEKGTIIPDLDINSSVESRIEMSLDNIKFVPINWSDISNYSFRFLRITFPKAKGNQSSTFLRTLRFDYSQQDIYIVAPKSGIPIQVYRGWSCDSGRLSLLQSELNSLSKNISLVQSSKNIIPIKFSQVIIEGKDSDGDGIIDMRDNCSSISNSNQSDRNFDGKGDACTDDDGDGVTGVQDNCPTINNSDQKDLNANNIGDACEFDRDKDSIMDGADNCINLANTNQQDDDFDGIGDACDNCNIFNPDQLDLNNNGIGDACESRDEFNKKNDSDKDGILDFSDNCIKIFNPDQRDQDKDGIGDACDNCFSIKNTNQQDANKNGKGDMCEDIDSDGIDGWRDNCPTTSNVNQQDSNNDGIGDACTDTDFDNVYDPVDNCPLVYNPDQKNTDKDNLGDACDIQDNRMIESNRTLFMILFGCISLFFIGGIVFFIRKIKL